MKFILEPEIPFEEAIAGVPESDFVEIDGRRIRVREVGEGPTLVMLHGFASSSHAFRKIIAPLSCSYRILAIDLDGFGLTERPHDFDAYQIGNQAELITKVMRAKGVDEAALVGHSYGCAVSMVFSVKYPELLSKLVLISPPSDFAKKPPFYIRNGVGIRFAFFLIHALLSNGKRFHKLTLRAFFVKEALPFEDSEVYRREMLTEGLKKTCRGYARAFAGGGASAVRYDSIEKPTLVVAGVEDTVVPVDSCVAVAESIPQSDLRTIPHCGHCPPEERPEEVIQAITDFV